MKHVFIALTFFISSAKVAAQVMFDMPTCAVLIDHNKRNFKDHQDLMSNQITSTVTVNELNTSTSKMKQLTDGLEKRVNQVFIIITDAYTTYHIYQSLDLVYAAQSKAIGLLSSHPELTPFVVGYEQKIVNSAEDLFLFCYAIVLSYGDFNKITVADRKQIYNNLDHTLSRLVINANAMVYEIQLYSLQKRFKDSHLGTIINNDKNLSKDILNSFHF